MGCYLYAGETLQQIFNPDTDIIYENDVTNKRVLLTLIVLFLKPLLVDVIVSKWDYDRLWPGLLHFWVLTNATTGN